MVVQCGALLHTGGSWSQSRCCLSEIRPPGLSGPRPHLPLSSKISLSPTPRSPCTFIACLFSPSSIHQQAFVSCSRFSFRSATIGPVASSESINPTAAPPASGNLHRPLLPAITLTSHAIIAITASLATRFYAPVQALTISALTFVSRRRPQFVSSAFPSTPRHVFIGNVGRSICFAHFPISSSIKPSVWQHTPHHRHSFY